MDYNVIDAFRRLDVERDKLHQYESQSILRIQNAEAEVKLLSKSLEAVKSNTHRLRRVQDADRDIESDENRAYMRLGEKIQDLTQNADLQAAEIASLKADISEQQKAVSELAERFAENKYDQLVEEMELAKADQSEKVREVTDQLKSSRDDLLALKTTNDAVIGGLKKQVLALCEELSESELRNQEADAAFSQNEKKIADLNRQVEEQNSTLLAEAKIEQELDDQLCKANEEKENLNEQVKFGHEEVAKLEAEIGQFHQNSRFLMNQIEDDMRRAQELSMDWQVSRELMNLKLEIAQSKYVENRLNNQLNEYTKMVEKTKALLLENETKGRMIDERGKHIEATLEMCAKKEEATQRNLKLKASIDALEKELMEESQTRSLKVKEFETSLCLVKKEIDSKLAEMKSVQNQLQQEQKVLQDEIANLVGQEKALSEDLSKSKSSEEVDQEISELEGKTAQRKETISNLDEKLADAQLKLDNKAKYADKLVAEICRQHKALINPMKSKLESLNHECSKLDKQIKELEEKNKKKKAMVSSPKSFQTKKNGPTSTYGKKAVSKEATPTQKLPCYSPAKESKTPKTSSKMLVAKAATEKKASPKLPCYSPAKEPITPKVSKKFFKSRTPGTTEKRKVSFADNVKSTDNHTVAKRPKKDAKEYGKRTEPRSVKKRKLFDVNGYDIFDEDPDM